jgi:hypothetical protein
LDLTFAYEQCGWQDSERQIRSTSVTCDSSMTS